MNDKLYYTEYFSNLSNKFIVKVYQISDNVPYTLRHGRTNNVDAWLRMWFPDQKLIRL